MIKIEQFTPGAYLEYWKRIGEMNYSLEDYSSAVVIAIGTDDETFGKAFYAFMLMHQELEEEFFGVLSYNQTSANRHKIYNLFFNQPGLKACAKDLSEIIGKIEDGSKCVVTGQYDSDTSMRYFFRNGTEIFPKETLVYNAEAYNNCIPFTNRMTIEHNFDCNPCTYSYSEYMLAHEILLHPERVLNNPEILSSAKELAAMTDDITRKVNSILSSMGVDYIFKQEDFVCYGRLYMCFEGADKLEHAYEFDVTKSDEGIDVTFANHYIHEELPFK